MAAKGPERSGEHCQSEDRRRSLAAPALEARTVGGETAAQEPEAAGDAPGPPASVQEGALKQAVDERREDRAFGHDQNQAEC